MISIPSDVNDILKSLKDNKHSAYVVGGCVRDFLLGKNPKDWDIATSATPEEVESIFDRVIDHGREYGGVKVLYNNEIYDITTYRSESEYLDFRRPNIVEYSTQIIDDLKRRDYSINAIAFSEEDGFIDPYNGQADIAKKIIRCVGNADERFIEDPLRILRGIRLASDLKFEIENDTKKSMAKNSQLVKKVSKERIRNEFNRILVSKKPIVGLSVLDEVGVMPFVLSAQLSHKKIDFNHKKLLHMRDIEYVLDDRLIYFFIYLMEESDYDAREIKDMLVDLKYSNKTIGKVVLALELYPLVIQENSLKEFKQIISCSGLIEIKQLLRLARELNRDNDSAKENVEEEEKMLSMIMGKHHPIFMKDLNIKGNDLIEVGIPQDAQLGNLMKDLLVFIHLNPEENNKEKLLQVAQELVHRR